MILKTKIDKYIIGELLKNRKGDLQLPVREGYSYNITLNMYKQKIQKKNESQLHIYTY